MKQNENGILEMLGYMYLRYNPSDMLPWWSKPCSQFFPMHLNILQNYVPSLGVSDWLAFNCCAWFFRDDSTSCAWQHSNTNRSPTNKWFPILCAPPPLTMNKHHFFRPHYYAPSLINPLPPPHNSTFWKSGNCTNTSNSGGHDSSYALTPHPQIDAPWITLTPRPVI